MSPVPQQTSSTRAPGFCSTEENVFATLDHQRRSVLNESRWFSRSYRGAIAVNISRTARAAELPSAAPSGAAPTTLDLRVSGKVAGFMPGRDNAILRWPAPPPARECPTRSRLSQFRPGAQNALPRSSSFCPRGGAGLLSCFPGLLWVTAPAPAPSKLSAALYPHPSSAAPPKSSTLPPCPTPPLPHAKISYIRFPLPGRGR